MSDDDFLAYVAEALAAEREYATCGDTLAKIAVCELHEGHSGWHQMTDNLDFPPVRWINAEGIKQ